MGTELTLPAYRIEPFNRNDAVKGLIERSDLLDASRLDARHQIRLGVINCFDFVDFNGA